jgi:hypothetical protein
MKVEYGKRWSSVEFSQSFKKDFQQNQVRQIVIQFFYLSLFSTIDDFINGKYDAKNEKVVALRLAVRITI